MLALLPVLALIATSTLAAPLEPRQNATTTAGQAKGCTRKWRGQGYHPHHGNHTWQSHAPVVSGYSSFSGAPTSTEVVLPTSTEVVASSSSASSAASSAAAVASSSAVESQEGTPTSAEVIASVSASATESIVASSAIGNSHNVIPSSVSAASPSPSSTGAPSGFEKEITDLHNTARAEYGAGALTWNNTLAAYAQEHADKCQFKHSGGPYGENLAAGVGGGYDAADGFQGWMDEAAKYNYSDPVFSDATGHFTQVVWKDTSQLGCALVNCPAGSIFDKDKYPSDNILLWCNYYKPGNYAGEFAQNVGHKSG